MQERNTNEIKSLIKKREVHLKKENRAKTLHPEQYNKDDKWYCGEKLDYRFAVVKTLLTDILEGEKEND